MMWNQLKTVILLGSLTGLLFLLGHFLGGMNGVVIAFTFSLLMNIGAYFFSDKLVLRMYRAQKLDREKYSHIYAMVEELCLKAALPMPKLWYVATSMPNAFATGRNPKNASVAVTQGILNLLEEHELRGVLAHEISHIKNRDILVSTIAAVMASAIAHIAYMLRWTAILGGGNRSNDRGNGALGAIGLILLAVLMPLAATLIQLSISRSREYLADESGADYSDDPLALASALEKIEYGVKADHLNPESAAHTSTAGLFIMHPFSGGGLTSLFSTHPPTKKRVARLRKMAT